MAYAYEDDDELLTNEVNDEEELDENLNVKIKLPRKKEEIKEVEQSNSKVSMDALLAVDNERKDYSIDNLLKEEQEVEGVSYDNLLTKKDDKLFKLYLGSGYEKLTSKLWNWAAFFFGPIYLIYRKVYMVGFVWLFLNEFIVLFSPIAKVNPIITIIILIISIICIGLFSNQIILNHVGTKIVNYKMVEDDKEKLRKMVEKNGGTNFLLAFIVCLIVSGLSSMVINSQLMGFLDESNSTYNPSMFNEDRVYFNGQVQIDENINISDNVTLQVPEDFYLANDDNYRYYYVYKDPDAHIPLCSIELEKVKGYKTPELFISAIASYHLELEENIKTLENNYLWKYINVTDSSKNIYYATTSINNDMYLLKLTYQYTLEEECGSHFEEVLNSINNT